MRRLFLVLILSTFAVACDKKSKKPDGDLATPREPVDLLSSIPADTPYAIVAMDPPRGLTAKAVSWIGGLTPDGDLQAQLEDPFVDAGTKALLVVGDELSRNATTEGYQALGLHWSAPVALYGYGLLPAVRQEIDDREKFMQFLTRVEEKSGLTRKPEEVDGKTFWSYDLASPDSRVVMTVDDRTFTAAVVHTAVAPQVVEMMLGLKKPSVSLRDAGKLADIRKTWGFSGYADGFVDVAGIVQSALDPQPGLNGDVMAAMMGPEGLGPVSDACRSETLALVAKLPRMVWTADKSADGRLTYAMGLEVTDGLGSELIAAKAPAPLYGAPAMKDAAVVAALGLNVGKVIDIVGKRLRMVTDSPYQCEWFARANFAAEEVVGKLLFIPPMISQIDGAAVILTEATENPQAGAAQPMNPTDPMNGAMDAMMSGSILRGMAAISTPSPGPLFEFIQSFDDRIINVEVKPDGVPVPLPPLADMPVELPHVVMKPGILAATSGPTMPQQAADIMAQPAQESPMLTVKFDYTKLEADGSKEFPFLNGPMTLTMEPAERGLLFTYAMPPGTGQ